MNDMHPAVAGIAEREVQALLDAAVDAVIVIDHKGTVRQFSLAAQRMFGFAPNEVLGRNVSMLMPEPFRSEHDGYLDRYARTGEAHIIGIGREVSARRKDGSVFPCELAVGRVQGIDPPRFVGFIRDVSDRMRAEDEARVLRERLTHFSRLSTMGEMAAGLAHEINQPLTAIANYAYACLRMLRSEQATQEDVLPAMQQVAREAERAGEVVRKMRSFVRGDEGQLSAVEVGFLIGEVLRLAAPEARQAGVELMPIVAAGLPPVLADSIQIQQVLLNLVRNAVEAITAGGDPALREVRIAAARSPGGDVEITVEDTGPGLAPEALERVFEPFYTTKPDGIGIGLALSRSIVDAHGGRLWATAASGCGATFHLVLPVIPGEKAADA
jgi:two-component system sensor kinase FixL